MIQHIELNKGDAKKSVSLVTVGTDVVEVHWWYSLKFTMTNDELDEYLYAEAYWVIGAEAEAYALLEPKATGTVTTENKLDADGFDYTEKTDTRNWYKRWIDEHPIV